MIEQLKLQTNSGLRYQDIGGSTKKFVDYEHTIEVVLHSNKPFPNIDDIINDLIEFKEKYCD